MKLSKLILNAIFFTAIISIILTSVINLFFEINNLNDEKIRLNELFINEKKELIKNEVDKAISFIEKIESQNLENGKRRVKDLVDKAYTIANKIYDDNKHIKSKEEIQYLIVTTLQNISFENRDYFFINSNSGEAILFNKISKLNKNVNIWNLKDAKGKYFIQQQSKIAISLNEGFITNYFVKPDLDDNIEYPKISYIKNFEPYNWHIGLGIYLDDFEKDAKNEILNFISNIRFGKDGYIFVNSIDQKALVFDGKKLEEAKEYPNKELFEKQLNAVKNPNGDFFYYEFKKLDSTKKFPKMAFAKKYEKFDWIVGSGIYIDEIQNELNKKEELFKKMLIKQIAFLVSILIIIFIIIYYVSKKFSSYINDNLNEFVESFKEASKKLKTIKTDKLYFQEFTLLAKNLNMVLEKRNETESLNKWYLNLINKNLIIISTNKEGIIKEVNDSFLNITKYTKEELIGKEYNFLIHPEFLDKYTNVLEEISITNYWKGELRHLDKNGDEFWLEITIYPKKDNNENGYTALMQNITDKKRIEYLSITDELTKTYNRRFFNIKIEEEINRAKRGKYGLCLLILDIDYFKDYNDNYGHQEGDKVLEKVGQIIIKNTNRASDFGFRLGGEEFGIIFTHKQKDSALNYAINLKNEIENLNIEHKYSKASKYITCSIGLVVKNYDQIKNSNELYKLADVALYEAKNSGRNTVILSD